MNSLIEYTLYNQSSKQQHYLKNSQNGKDGFWSRTDHLDSEYGDKVLTTNTMFFNMGQTRTLFVLMVVLFSRQWQLAVQNKTVKVQIVCSGLEPRAPGW